MRGVQLQEVNKQKQTYFVNFLLECEMAEADSFSFYWHNHQSTIMGVLDSLLQEQTLVDVTLASEGRWLRAHRLVLSACSEYFKELLTFQPEKNAILYLKDVPFSHLQALIVFMYRGEVNISQDELPSFINTATSLRVKGLAENYAGPQESAIRPVDQCAESSLRRKNPLSQIPKVPLNSGGNFPCNSSASSLHANRQRFESPHETLTPSFQENCYRAERIPVVHFTPNDSVASADSVLSGSQSLHRTPVLSVVSASTTPRDVTVTDAPNCPLPEEFIRAIAQEKSARGRDPPCNIAVCGSNTEQDVLISGDLDDVIVIDEEEWSDTDDQDATQHEMEEQNCQASSGSDVASGSITAINGNPWSNQGEIPFLGCPPHENWRAIILGTGETRLQCVKCNRHYKHRKHVRRHLSKECDNQLRYICILCGFTTKQLGNLRRHDLDQHSSFRLTLPSQINTDSTNYEDPLAL